MRPLGRQVPKGVGDKLRAERRAANADDKDGKFPRRRRDHRHGSQRQIFDPRIRFFDIVSQAGTQANGITQPM
jgi:hypothetical protein